MNNNFMPNPSTQTLTKQQKELFRQLLDAADDKDEALTLTEFEGFFLCGMN
jgi:hypothetical protein